MLGLTLAQSAFAAPPSELMDEWRGYALSRITPEFSWAPAAPVAAPGVLERSEPGHMRMSVALESGTTPNTLDVDLRSTRLGGAAHRLHSAGEPDTLLRRTTSPLTGSIAQSGFGGHFGAHGHYGVGVVVANQRFASPSLNGASFSAAAAPIATGPGFGSSTGTGVEFSLGDQLAPGLDWYAGARSRISMNKLQNFRGIYGNPGDMDLPSTLRFGLEWLPTRASGLRFGVDRIQYSSIQPFVSAALPRRLLAMLGDGMSPAFQWRDLDIYSLTWFYRLDDANRVSFRYSTRQQPLPTSRVLAQLMLESAPKHALGLDYRHTLRRGEWRFAANYAPAEFILGVPTSGKVDRPSDGHKLEFEALWVVPF